MAIGSTSYRWRECDSWTANTDHENPVENRIGNIVNVARHNRKQQQNCRTVCHANARYVFDMCKLVRDHISSFGMYFKFKWRLDTKMLTVKRCDVDTLKLKEKHRITRALAVIRVRICFFPARISIPKRNNDGICVTSKIKRENVSISTNVINTETQKERKHAKTCFAPTSTAFLGYIWRNHRQECSWIRRTILKRMTWRHVSGARIVCSFIMQ